MKVKHKARILILDDEKDLREVLGTLLSEHFTEVVMVGSYADAITEMKKKEFDVVISDFKVNDKTGLDVRKWQMFHHPNCQFILLTGYANDPEIIEHLKADHFKILQKPAHPNELIFPLKKEFSKKKKKKTAA